MLRNGNTLKVLTHVGVRAGKYAYIHINVQREYFHFFACKITRVFPFFYTHRISFLFVCVLACLYLYTHKCAYLCDMRARTHTHLCVSFHVHTYTYTHTHTHAQTHIRAHAHTRTHTHVIMTADIGTRE